MTMTKRILIVEDEPDLAFILKAFLLSEGYDVEIAEDGVDGVEAAQANPPDLILMDVMMPEMNGYQACRLIKSDPLTQGVPVIMLTAKTYQTDRYWGLEAGADEYLTKPYDERLILSKIRSMIGA
jgi:DNA-binding response OmpR family regulator